MITEISRTPVEGENGAFIVQRVKNSDFEILKETTVNTGEVRADDTTTIQTITITRKIIKTEF